MPTYEETGSMRVAGSPCTAPMRGPTLAARGLGQRCNARPVRQTLRVPALSCRHLVHPRAPPHLGASAPRAVPFPCGLLSSRHRKQSIVAFRTEEGAEAPQDTAVVIGLDFYRCGAVLLSDGSEQRETAAPARLPSRTSPVDAEQMLISRCHGGCAQGSAGQLGREP